MIKFCLLYLYFYHSLYLLLHVKVIINYLKETLSNLYREEMHDIKEGPSLLGLFFCLNKNYFMKID